MWMKWGLGPQLHTPPSLTPSDAGSKLMIYGRIVQVDDL